MIWGISQERTGEWPALWPGAFWLKKQWKNREKQALFLQRCFKSWGMLHRLFQAFAPNEYNRVSGGSMGA